MKDNFHFRLPLLTAPAMAGGPDPGIFSKHK